MKDIKEVKRGRIKEYADRVEGASYTEGTGIWNIKCDVYLPCATQNELALDGAKTLVANGCKYVVEGANMLLLLMLPLISRRTVFCSCLVKQLTLVVLLLLLLR